MQSLTSGTVIARKLVDLADGNHFVVVSSGTASACGDLPNVINGAYSDSMVDMSLLAQYGISLREVNNTATSPLLIYVPLNVVPDDTGGGQTAFQAHLVYWPDAGRTWNASQKVNIVWAVQALTDRCNSDTFQYEDLEDYQDKTGDKDAEQEDYDKAFDAHCAKVENRLPDSASREYLRRRLVPGRHERPRGPRHGHRRRLYQPQQVLQSDLPPAGGGPAGSWRWG